jgi:hypothetical protein
MITPDGLDDLGAALVRADAPAPGEVARSLGALLDAVDAARSRRLRRSGRTWRGRRTPCPGWQATTTDASPSQCPDGKRAGGRYPAAGLIGVVLGAVEQGSALIEQTGPGNLAARRGYSVTR